MRYVVIALTEKSTQEIATKQSMDDALDVIKAMEEFDKAEAASLITEYRVAIMKEKKV